MSQCNSLHLVHSSCKSLFALLVDFSPALKSQERDYRLQIIFRPVLQLANEGFPYSIGSCVLLGLSNTRLFGFKTRQPRANDVGIGGQKFDVF
jgi:hypothetical protein